MIIIVGGIERSGMIPPSSINLDLGIGDHAGKLAFDLQDSGSQIPLAYGTPVLVHDENMPGTAYPVQTAGKILAYPVPPAENFIADAAFYSSGTYYTRDGSLLANLTMNFLGARFVFSNAALGTCRGWQLIPTGYLVPGQQYMFSAYAGSTVNAVNVTAYLQIIWIDADGVASLGSITTTFAPPSSGNQGRYSVSGVAPAGAAMATIAFGANTTVAGTNAGTFTISSLQLEPMYFTSGSSLALSFGQQAGVTTLYPTQDNNYMQQTSLTLPDGSCTRYTRIFAGYINDLSADYDGPNRIWKVSCASPTANIDSGGVNGNAAQINSSYTQANDTFIITDLISKYYNGLLTTSLPYYGAPPPLVQTSVIGDITYTDQTFRDILNGLVDLSGNSYYVGPDYRPYYSPLYYNSAWFTLTDGQADGITTFNYYNYEWHLDGTQVRKVVKVIGGNFLAPSITDPFTGNGSTTTFPLSFSPYQVSSVTVGGTGQKAGVSGVHTFAQGYTALIDKANQWLLFATAPASGVSATCTYSYEAPVSATVINQFSFPLPPAPAYVLPSSVSLVSDTSITDLPTATQRGFGELTKNGEPKLTITFSSPLWITPGYSVNFTSTPDGLINRPFVIWQVKGKYLGTGTNEYQYLAGNYVNPSFIDHMRHQNRLSSKSTSTANIAVAQRFDLVFNEFVFWGDQPPTLTRIPSAPSTYGSGTWGQSTYS